MKLLVTGATGLLGSHLIQHLSSNAREWNLVAWDRNVHGDLHTPGSVAPSLEREKPDQLLHLAWNPTGSSDYDVDVRNALWVEASLELARCCIEQGIQFFGVGTCLEYTTPVDDTPYLASKRALFAGLSDAIGLDKFTWIRPFWIVSKLDRRPRLVADALDALTQGRQFVPRNPQHRRDFIEISDVATALTAVLTNRAAGVIDIGAGETRTVGQLLRSVLDSPFDDLELPSSREAVPEGMADTRRLIEFGWAPFATDSLFSDHG